MPKTFGDVLRESAKRRAKNAEKARAEVRKQSTARAISPSRPRARPSEGPGFVPVARPVSRPVAGSQVSRVNRFGETETFTVPTEAEKFRARTPGLPTATVPDPSFQSALSAEEDLNLQRQVRKELVKRAVLTAIEPTLAGAGKASDIIGGFETIGRKSLLTATQIGEVAEGIPAGVVFASKAVGGDVKDAAGGDFSFKRSQEIGKQTVREILLDFQKPHERPGFLLLNLLGALSLGSLTGARVVTGAGRASKVGPAAKPGQFARGFLGRQPLRSTTLKVRGEGGTVEATRFLSRAALPRAVQEFVTSKQQARLTAGPGRTAVFGTRFAFDPESRVPGVVKARVRKVSGVLSPEASFRRLRESGRRAFVEENRDVLAVQRRAIGTRSKTVEPARKPVRRRLRAGGLSRGEHRALGLIGSEGHKGRRRSGKPLSGEPLRKLKAAQTDVVGRLADLESQLDRATDVSETGAILRQIDQLERRGARIAEDLIEPDAPVDVWRSHHEGRITELEANVTNVKDAQALLAGQKLSPEQEARLDADITNNPAGLPARVKREMDSGDLDAQKLDELAGEVDVIINESTREIGRHKAQVADLKLANRALKRPRKRFESAVAATERVSERREVLGKKLGVLGPGAPRRVAAPGAVVRGRPLVETGRASVRAGDLKALRRARKDRGLSKRERDALDAQIAEAVKLGEGARQAGRGVKDAEGDLKKAVTEEGFAKKQVELAQAKRPRTVAEAKARVAELRREFAKAIRESFLRSPHAGEFRKGATKQQVAAAGGRTVKPRRATGFRSTKAGAINKKIDMLHRAEITLDERTRRMFAATSPAGKKKATDAVESQKKVVDKIRRDLDGMIPNDVVAKRQLARAEAEGTSPLSKLRAEVWAGRLEHAQIRKRTADAETRTNAATKFAEGLEHLINELEAGIPQVAGRTRQRFETALANLKELSRLEDGIAKLAEITRGTSKGEDLFFPEDARPKRPPTHGERAELLGEVQKSKEAEKAARAFLERLQKQKVSREQVLSSRLAQQQEAIARTSTVEFERLADIGEAPEGAFYTPGWMKEARSVPKAKQPVEGAVKPNVGKIDPSLTNEFTGESLRIGRYRIDAAEMSGEALSKMIELVSTVDNWNDLWVMGSRTKLSSDMIPVMEPHRNKAAVQELLDVGDRDVTLSHKDLEVLNLAEQVKLLRTIHPEDVPVDADGTTIRAATIEVDAPEIDGVRWVKRDLVADTGDAQRRTPGRLAKAVDWINNPLRALTLYLRVAYVMNLPGNIGMLAVKQGFLAPGAMARSVRSRSLYGDAATDRMNVMVGEGRSRASRVPTGPAARQIEWIAEKWAFMVDDWMRRAAFLANAKRKGWDGSSDHLNEILFSDNKTSVAWRREIRERANKDMVDFSNMTPAEKNVLRHWLFVYPWVSRATIWSMRTMYENPGKVWTTSQLSREADKRYREQLGWAPRWLSHGYFSIGDSKDSMTVLNLNNLNTLTTGTDTGRILTGQLLTGTGEGPVIDSFGPAAKMFGRIVGGTARAAKSGELGAFPAGVTQAFGELPQTAMLARLGLFDGVDGTTASVLEFMGLKTDDKKRQPLDDRKVFGEKGLLPAALPFIFGQAAPKAARKDVVKAKGLKEHREGLTSKQRVIFDASQERETITGRLRKQGSIGPRAKLPAEFNRAIRLRTQRAISLAALEDTVGQASQRERLRTDLSTLKRLRILDHDTARQIFSTWKHFTPDEIEQFRRSEIAPLFNDERRRLLKTHGLLDLI